MPKALEKRGGEIVTWMGEREARYTFAWRGQRLLLSPDAYCLWELAGEEGTFFLAWDRGTESIVRFAEKLARYEAYDQGRAYRDHFGELGLKPQLLIVVIDERREERLADWLAGRMRSGESVSLPTVLVAMRERALGDVLAPVWRRAKDGCRIGLVD